MARSCDEIRETIKAIQQEIADGIFSRAIMLENLQAELEEANNASESIKAEIQEIQAEIAAGLFDRAPALPGLQDKLAASGIRTTSGETLKDDKKSTVEQEVSKRRKLVEAKMKKEFGKEDQSTSVALVNNHPDGAKSGRLNIYKTDILRALGCDHVEECKLWLADPDTHIEDTEKTREQTALIWCSRRGGQFCGCFDCWYPIAIIAIKFSLWCNFHYLSTHQK